MNFVLNSNATVKEAQAVARHATPELTINVYGRRRSERLSEIIEEVAEELKLELECIPDVYQHAAGVCSRRVLTHSRLRTKKRNSL